MKISIMTAFANPLFNALTHTEYPSESGSRSRKSEYCCETKTRLSENSNSAELPPEVDVPPPVAVEVVVLVLEVVLLLVDVDAVVAQSSLVGAEVPAELKARTV